MQILRKLIRQHRPRLWLGAARDMLSRAQTYYALLNLPLLLVTAYTVREATIKKYVPWFTLPMFFGILLVGIIIVIIIDYKIVYPSVIAFHQHEAWKHRSLARKNLDKQRRRLDKMEATLERIERKLNGLR